MFTLARHLSVTSLAKRMAAMRPAPRMMSGSSDQRTELESELKIYEEDLANHGENANVLYNVALIQVQLGEAPTPHFASAFQEIF